MLNARMVRIWLFSSLVIVLLFSGVCVTDNQARGLMQSGGIGFTKTGVPATFSQAGEQITYTYQITNNNPTYLNLIEITDSPLDGKVNCPNASLAPGKKMTCTGKYTVTEQDVANGSVRNSAKLTARNWREEPKVCCDCGNTLYSDEVRASFTATLVPPTLELNKTGSPTTFNGPDQQITYTYVVKNTGSTTITGPVQIQDNLTQVTCPVGDLAPNQSITCTSKYITTLEDVAAGAITNHATAAAGDASASDSFTIRMQANPALRLVKSADPMVFTRENELVKFTFTVTNSGDVPLSGPYQVEDTIKLYDLTCPDQILAPGDSLECSGWYRVLSSDIGNSVTNCATASGYFYSRLVESNEACIDVDYQPPRQPEIQEQQAPPSACDLDPSSYECYCEQNPGCPQ
jgi:uncharacterized repeat protein (TIGR01451 family)